MTKFSAKSTLTTAFRERAYQIILAVLALVTLAGIFKLVASWPIEDIEGVFFDGPTLAGIGVLAIYFQLRHMSSVYFELSDKGLHHEEDSRKHFFAWKEIKAIGIEPGRKRLTVWTEKSVRYMRYLGITESEFAPLKQFLLAKMSQHGIQQRE